MNEIFRYKQNLTNLCVLILVIFCSNLAQAQPGWQDFTPRYSYTILDADENEISFVNNKNYSIMIDSVLYKTPNIPQDSLKQASPSDEGYENQIRINDFSLAVQKRFFQQGDKRLEIKIIHKQDTMYICQPSGMGSFYWSINFQGESIIPESDYTLPFIAGHYYFPNWVRGYILNNLPEISGDVKFLNTANLNQPYFIIPGNIYNSSLLPPNPFAERTGADDYVIDNFFLKGYFSIEKRIEPTKNNQLPFEYSWIGNPVPTKDPNRFWGMINYSGSFFSQRTTFFTLNKEENTIELFLPTEDPRLFNCRNNAPYINPFNLVIYLPVWIKQEFNDSLFSAVEYNKMLPEKYIYRSEDEGKTWEEDKKAKEIFDKYHFFEGGGRMIEFLDKDYAVVYFKEIVERNKKKNQIRQQGIYYLLKNMQVIDSIKSPIKASYYANYRSENKDIILGSWTYDYDKTFFQLSLKKVNNEWEFQVEKRFYAQNSEQQHKQKRLEKDTIKEYKNFHLINNKELVFKNGSGKLKLKNNVNDNLIIEKDNQIYLISPHCVYVSFDRGTNWCIYPASIFPNTYYYLLDINEQNEISYFSNKRTDSKNSKTIKTFYKFSPE